MDDDLYKLKHGYISAVEGHGGIPVILPPQKDASGTSEKIDGLLISGGSDILPEYYGEKISVPSECLKSAKKERTDFELALLIECTRRKMPVLSICYGMQLLNIAFGGSIHQDIKHNLPDALDHRSGTHKINIHPVLGFKEQTATVNSSHHQAIKTVGAGLEVFAASEDGIVEGIIKKDYNFMVGVQWHPERIQKEELSAWIFKTFIYKAKEEG
ncbi:MAG: gamma-glutamyl-gamma-aminobutyrate hydrolase family protein [Nitrospirae bacterium]|nr:MAG: gamma-glutamyl-gamma-aminobutyrate hydrolase family protein [Nitrospirota bacterium]